MRKIPIIVYVIKGKNISAWDCNTGEIVYSLIDHNNKYECAEFIPARENSKQVPLLLAGGEDKMIKIFNLDTGVLLQSLTGHEGTISCMLNIPFSDLHEKSKICGEYFVSVDHSNNMKIWSKNTFEMKASYRTTNRNRGVNYTLTYFQPSQPDMNPMVICQDEYIHYFYDLIDLKDAHVFGEGEFSEKKNAPLMIPHNDTVHNCTLSALKFQSKARVYQIIPELPYFDLEHDKKTGVSDIAYCSPEQNSQKLPILISVDYTTLIKVWNLNDQTCINSLKLQEKKDGMLKLMIVPSEFNQFGFPLLVATTSFKIHTIDLDDFYTINEFIPETYTNHLVFMPANENTKNIPTLISLQKDCIHFYDLNHYNNKRILQIGDGKNEFINKMVVAIDDVNKNHKIVCATNSTLAVFNPKTGKCDKTIVQQKTEKENDNNLRLLKYEKSVEGVNNGPTLITVDDRGQLHFWDSITMEIISTLQMERMAYGFCEAFYIPSVGKINSPLIYFYTCFSIQAWDLNTKEKLFLKKFDCDNTKVTFIPENQNKFDLPLIMMQNYEKSVQVVNALDMKPVQDLKMKSKMIREFKLIPGCDMASNSPFVACWEEGYDPYSKYNLMMIDMFSLTTKKLAFHIKEIDGTLYMPPTADSFNTPLYVIGERNGKISFLDLNKMEILKTLGEHGDSAVTHLTIIPSTEQTVIPDGPLLVSVMEKGQVRLWDFHLGHCVYSYNGGDSLPGKVLLIPGEAFKPSTLACLRIQASHLITLIDLTREFSETSFTVSNHGKHFIHDKSNPQFGLITDGQFNILDVPTMNFVKQIKNGGQYLDRIKIKEEENLVFGNCETTKQFDFHHSEDFTVLKTLNVNHDRSVRTLFIKEYPHKEVITFFGFDDGSLVLMDFDKNIKLATIHQHLHIITKLCSFSFGERNFFVTGDKDGVVKFMNLDGRVCYEPEIEDQKILDLTYLFAENKHFLLGVYGNTVRLWNAAFSSSMQTKNGFKNFVSYGPNN